MDLGTQSTRVIKAPNFLQFIGLFTWIFGALLNTISYYSFKPVLVYCIYFFVFMLPLILTRFGGKYERKVFILLFNISYFMSGIAAIYANQFADPIQTQSDAISLYEISLKSGDLGLTSLVLLSEGSLAIVIWGYIYYFFNIIGLESGPYIGIIFNSSIVSITGVLAIKITKIVYGVDHKRMQRLIVLIAFCGTFWMFASIHLRDSFILFFITLLYYFWISYLNTPYQLIKFILFFNINVSFGIMFFFLRTEFSMLPFSFLLAAVMAIFTSNRKFTISPRALLIIPIGISCICFLLLQYFDTIMMYLGGAGNAYSLMSAESSSDTSLGVSLVTSQPVYIKAVFGSIYLLLFPIPFWTGFFSQSVYHVFKSFNVFFMYLALPLFASGFVDIMKRKTHRSTVNLFTLYLVILSILAVAVTSLESRHIAVFYIPFIIFTLLPDLRSIKVRKVYYLYLSVLVIAMIGIHFIWAILKLM